jgi:hypothetical protein
MLYLEESGELALGGMLLMIMTISPPVILPNNIHELPLTFYPSQFAYGDLLPVGR